MYNGKNRFTNHQDKIKIIITEEPKRKKH